MIERTRRKLDEARFFYGHLVNERRKTFRHDPLAFRYYFSAFIQAARDVLRRAHYEEKGKWEAWEPKWRAKRSEEEQKLLDLTNELRINEVHRGGVDPIVEEEEVAIQNFSGPQTLALEDTTRLTVCIDDLRYPEFRSQKSFVRPITLRTRRGRRK
jgi:hypothetical protein